MRKKTTIGWILLVVVALFFCTPLGAIPAFFFGVFIYPTLFARNIEQGKPLVRAIYGYRSATGLYPARLDDLVPTYIAAVPEGWEYTPQSREEPPRLRLHGGFHSELTYHFARPTNSKPPPGRWPEGWGYSQEGTEHFAGKDRIPVPPPQKPKDELAAARLKELRRRVDVAKKDGGLLDAYTRLISELVRLGRSDEARAACRHCIDAVDARWCRVALAELDLRCGETAGLDELVAWTRRSPSFPRYYALAQLYRQHGKTAEALAAIGEGVKHTSDVRNDEEIYSTEAICNEAALFTYRNGRHDLILAICDKWERFVQAQGYGDASYHAMRAATYLATGRQPEAAQEVDRAVRANEKSRTWADNLPTLERAIQAGDRNFVYEPDESPLDYRIFLGEIQ
jgi:hypothetical protein